MKLEFDIYKVKEECKLNAFLQSIGESEFIVTGKELIEDEEHYLLQELNEDGLRLVKGLNIQMTSYRIPKRFLVKKEFESVELDIPKDYLTMDIVEEIQELNRGGINND